MTSDDKFDGLGQALSVSVARRQRERNALRRDLPQWAYFLTILLGAALGALDGEIKSIAGLPWRNVVLWAMAFLFALEFGLLKRRFEALVYLIEHQEFAPPNEAEPPSD